ncbi:MAG: alpha-ketoglutarate-dependent dioxygenase AlkB [Halieaceae bacterium]|jgi:alkylated DNA repair dioxygenase AlkB|nr:alpha-ketoglutarate-dependent dioxygenase AlkB [Halieaceae bacterium]
MDDTSLSLFPGEGLEPVAIPGAQVSYTPSLALSPSADACLAALIEETPWRQDPITLFGKTVMQPRLHAWYGDEGAHYAYSGLALAPLPWTPLLSALKSQVEAACGHDFNSVLLNYYRDHRDSMGMHADDEPELGPEPVIASLSLGEQRPLRFKHRHDREVESVKLPLAHGSLLLMAGQTQRNWHHGMAKQARPCGPRVNLTFRKILSR